ncbi:MAG TPA: dipicolinate synthase subunit DpsA [Stellaceae bacterium]|nr:dipicolinate synthase subunit DpsA [Stellaceae bacterium]
MAPIRHWHDLTTAIVGGDTREAEIARLAAATGAAVRAFGFPWPDAGIADVAKAASAAEATIGASIALFPIAGIKDGCLYAPSLREPIRIDTTLLSGMTPGGHIICGGADTILTREAERHSLTIHAYEHDQESRLLRAPSVVEGVLATLIANTDHSLHGAEIAVLGQGVLGRLLALALHKLGARVHAIARDPVQRAEAAVQGINARDFDGLGAVAPGLDILVSAVPIQIVDAQLLRRLRPGALVVDLASPPGSVDLDAAKALPIKAVWARGLGARAPVTVGRAQWLAIRRRIETIYKL